MATHSVRDKVREVVDVLTPRVGEMDGMTEELREQAIATATSELLKIIESEVIGEENVEWEGDYWEEGRNSLRESQRTKLGGEK